MISKQIGEEMVAKWRTIPRDEHIPLRQHMMAVALKSIIRTSFGEDYFKTNKEILELEKAYEVVIMLLLMIMIVPVTPASIQFANLFIRFCSHRTIQGGLQIVEFHYKISILF